MINEVTLIGNIGQDPEIKSVPSGILAKISVATEDNWKNRQGEWQSKTQWHRCVAFGFAAEYIDRYIKKGMQVYIKGSMDYGSYEKDGITRYTAEVKIMKIKILGKKDGDSYYSNDKPASTPSYTPPTPTNKSNFEDDVPF